MDLCPIGQRIRNERILVFFTRKEISTNWNWFFLFISWPIRLIIQSNLNYFFFSWLLDFVFGKISIACPGTSDTTDNNFSDWYLMAAASLLLTFPHLSLSLSVLLQCLAFTIDVLPVYLAKICWNRRKYVCVCVRQCLPGQGIFFLSIKIFFSLKILYFFIFTNTLTLTLAWCIDFSNVNDYDHDGWLAGWSVQCQNIHWLAVLFFSVRSFVPSFMDVLL